eukprot:6970705-Alexandrium_andersonii.AAC.1
MLSLASVVSPSCEHSASSWELHRLPHRRSPRSCMPPLRRSLTGQRAASHYARHQPPRSGTCSAWLLCGSRAMHLGTVR